MNRATSSIVVSKAFNRLAVGAFVDAHLTTDNLVILHIQNMPCYADSLMHIMCYEN
ncbi:hypothetical protein RchiOBHm_Chr4g0415211 [Rosa chinensis]|uniref:Uncharacterized protein n=1 Tax=Rosa chinensis TaxID=74649 RepID=A0A2P6QWL6_ROSCH|nr:hypothetical protein RchiOBHm_Chr4g0415211 [Rosa chinensis]